MCKQHEGTAPIHSIVQDEGVAAPDADPGLLDDLVMANRILYKHGVVDAFGHVSVRHNRDKDRFLLSSNLAPQQVTGTDIVEFDLSSTPVNSNGRPVYLERFIHGEIYKAMPDVQAVVHSHSHSVVPFGVAKKATLRPLWHMSGFLGTGVPVFEIRDVAGDATDLLIRSNMLGKALADSLAQSCVVLMRGHGATIVASSLKMAVFRAVYTQLNAEIQLQAMGLGEIEYLTSGEAASAATSVGSQVDRAWNHWKSQV